jgi:hypothetical protein
MIKNSPKFAFWRLPGNEFQQAVFRRISGGKTWAIARIH